jgi:hypothetical protein
LLNTLVNVVIPIPQSRERNLPLEAKDLRDSSNSTTASRGLAQSEALRSLKELRKRGVGRDWAVRIASSGLGPWRLSHEPSICQALPNAFFHALGLLRLTGGS